MIVEGLKKFTNSNNPDAKLARGWIKVGLVAAIALTVYECGLKAGRQSEDSGNLPNSQVIQPQSYNPEAVLQAAFQIPDKVLNTSTL